MTTVSVAFPTSTVLGIFLVGRCPVPFEQVQDLLRWMTGDLIVPHQMPRVGKVCGEYLCEVYPSLLTLVSSLDPAVTSTYQKELIERVQREHGLSMQVPKLPEGRYRFVDPIAEYTQAHGAPGSLTEVQR